MPLGFGVLGFDLAKPNPFLSWSRVGAAAFWNDGVVDNPLAGVVDVETLGIWLDARPRRPFDEEVTTRGVGSMVECM